MRNTVHYLPFPISARLRPRPDCVSSSLCRCPAATILFCFCTTIGIFTAYHGGIFDDNFWAQTAITSDLIDEGSFPRNASIGSTAFNFKFGLLNANAQPFASILNKLGLSDDKITTEDFDNVSLNDVEIVTAWSMNHHAEAVRLCKNILQYDELLNKTHLRLISYNLGDVPPSVVDSFLRSCSIAKMRTFNFTGLPPYIRDLLQYRWKPLIIADVLRDSKAVLWIDSSTMFIKDAVSLQDIFEREAKEHQGVWLFEQTCHSIAAATNPLMYKYFPMAEQHAISMDMWGANIMLWIGRTNVKVEIMKPFVECALIEDCMSPPGSELHCVFPAGNARLYANCHRYDQAAINLILALRSGLNASKYTISNSVLKARRL